MATGVAKRPEGRLGVSRGRSSGSEPWTREGPNRKTIRKSELETSKGMKRQTSNGLPEQLSFGWEERGCVGHGIGSDAVSGAARQVVGQVPSAEESARALKQDLMGRVAEEANLVEALGRVCANQGSAGVDGMSVTELKAWMSVRANREQLCGPDCSRSGLSCCAQCLLIGTARCRAGTPGGVRGEEAQASPLSRFSPQHSRSP